MAKDTVKAISRIVVIGGSAGSLDVILKMLPSLEADLPFPVIIVLHRKSSFDSSLTDLFVSKTSLPVREAEEKDELANGWVYLAPPDYHLLIEKDGSFSLDFSEKVNYSRPSIDVTFESAVEVAGSGVVGILLSGANADGVSGLETIHEAGGITAVQNPATAEVSYMPAQALKHARVDYVLENDGIASFLNKLSRQWSHSE